MEYVECHQCTNTRNTILHGPVRQIELNKKRLFVRKALGNEFHYIIILPARRRIFHSVRCICRSINVKRKRGSKDWRGRSEYCYFRTFQEYQLWLKVYVDHILHMLDANIKALHDDNIIFLYFSTYLPLSLFLLCENWISCFYYSSLFLFPLWFLYINPPIRITFHSLRERKNMFSSSFSSSSWTLRCEGRKTLDRR